MKIELKYEVAGQDPVVYIDGLRCKDAQVEVNPLNGGTRIIVWYKVNPIPADGGPIFSKPPLHKPPQGLRPRYIADEERLAEIEAAVSRYTGDGKDKPRPVPVEWVNEYKQLLTGLMQRRVALLTKRCGVNDEENDW